MPLLVTSSAGPEHVLISPDRQKFGNKDVYRESQHPGNRRLYKALISVPGDLRIGLKINGKVSGALWHQISYKVTPWDDEEEGSH